MYGLYHFRQVIWDLVDFAFNHNSLIYAGPIFQLFFLLFVKQVCIQADSIDEIKRYHMI